MPTTTNRDPASLMRTAFDAVAAQDLDGLRALWDDQSHDVFHALGIEARGPEELGAFFTQMWAAIEDFSFVVEDVHGAEGGVAVGQWHLTGRFAGGPFQGIEPTGRPVDLRGCDVMRFEDGLLRRNDVYYDGLAFARQIGLLPPADSSADRVILGTFNAVTKARTALRRQFG